jgi:hypothetical protein
VTQTAQTAASAQLAALADGAAARFARRKRMPMIALAVEGTALLELDCYADCDVPARVRAMVASLLARGLEPHAYILADGESFARCDRAGRRVSLAMLELFLATGQ